MCAKRAHARARARACVHARTYKKFFFFQKKLQNFFFAVRARDCTYACDCTCARTRARTHVRACVQKKLNFFFLKKIFFQNFLFRRTQVWPTDRHPNAILWQI